MDGLLCGAAAGLVAGPGVRTVVARHAVPSGEPPRPYRFPGGRAGGPTAVVELVAVATGAAIGRGAQGSSLALLGLLALFGVPLAFIDLAVFRLPDRLTVPLALGTAALLLLLEHRPAVLLRCLLAATLLAGGFALLALVAPIGLGDAKLAVTLGLILGRYGWRTVFVGFLYAFLLLGLWGCALRLTGRVERGAELAFGPHLLLGTLLAALAAG